MSSCSSQKLVIYVMMFKLQHLHYSQRKILKIMVRNFPWKYWDRLQNKGSIEWKLNLNENFLLIAQVKSFFVF